MGIARKTFEKISLFLRMIYINKKFTVVAFLGLGISLSLVASNLIFLYSFQFDAFNTYITENPSEQLTVSPNSLVSSLGREEIIIPDLEAAMDQALVDSQLEEKTIGRLWFNRRGVFLPYVDMLDYNKTALFASTLVGTPAQYFPILEPYLLEGGHLPTDPSEVLLLLRTGRLSHTNFSHGITEMYVPVSPTNNWLAVETGIPDAGAYMNISGIVDVYELQAGLSNSTDERLLVNHLLSIIQNDEMIITTHRNVMSFTDTLTGFPSIVQPHKQNYLGSILFNLNEIDSFNLDGELRKFLSLNERLRNEIESTEYFSDLHIDLDLVIILQDFVAEFEVFRVFVLLFMVPIIGMALSLTAYSSNLIKKRRKRQLSLLRQRGSSRAEIITLMLIELVLFTFIAVILGFIIAYPYSYLIMKSSGFLVFSGKSVIPRFYLFIVEIVVLAGFVGSLLINITNIWRLSEQTQEEAFTERHEKKPFWEKYYVDIFFLVLGITAWIITSIQLKNSDVSTEFARAVGAPAPILVIIGSVMLFTRVFPLITQFISKITWRFSKLELISLASKGLSRRRSATMRSLVLIMLTFTMAVASIIIPDSYQAFDSENAQYQLGSDIVASGISIYDQGYRENIEAIEGVEATAYVNLLSLDPVTRGSVTYTYTVIGINATEFQEVAYFEKEYFRGNAKDIIDTLNSPPENSTANVLVNKGQVNPLNVSQVGEEIPIIYSYQVGAEPREEIYNVTITGFFEYWPVIYKQEPDPASTNFRLSIVTDLWSVYDLTLDSYDIYTQLYIKVKDGYDIKAIATEVEEYSYGRGVRNVDDLITIAAGSLRATVIFGSLNSNFIASVFILLFSILLMMLIQNIERSNEVGIMKAVGISPRQLFTYFFTEASTVLTVGAIAGVLLGIISSVMFMSIIAINTFVPPWEMVFSAGKLILTVFGMVLASILSGAIPGLIAANKKEAVIMREV